MDLGTLMSESLYIYVKLRHLMQRLQNRSRFCCRANKRPQTRYPIDVYLHSIDQSRESRGVTCTRHQHTGLERGAGHKRGNTAHYAIVSAAAAQIPFS